METKSFKINIPEGFEIDKEKSTFEKIVFKPIKKEFPESWEELRTVSGYCSDANSKIFKYENIECNKDNRNVFPTLEEAEASVALAQLCQLRDIYNKGWKPDWENLNTKYCIFIKENRVALDSFTCFSKVLHFKNVGLAQQFLKNFRDLIEKAKPLL